MANHYNVQKIVAKVSMLKGEKGDKGDKGDQGEKGEKGEKGDRGDLYGAQWGDIVGTLSNQTDLQSALDGKADASHTHAISDVTDLRSTLDEIQEDADEKIATAKQEAIDEACENAEAIAGNAVKNNVEYIVEEDSFPMLAMLTESSDEATFLFSSVADIPASASASGRAGQVVFDGSNDYVYICIATDTWKRFVLSDF